ncbi:MAG: hypothetical protein ACYCX4_01430 [Bacillota bacterium]
MNIYGCMPTYDSLAEKGDVIVNFIECFAERIIKTLDKELIIDITGKRLRNKKGYYSQDWEKLKKSIIEGKVTNIFICHWDENLRNKNISPMPLALRITSNLEFNNSDVDCYRASSIEFALSKLLYEGKPIRDYQHIYSELLEYLHLELTGAGGFLTIDNLTASYCFSPHERYIGLSYPKASTQFNRYYRGYHWGNYLSSIHVELLGGG